jgi:hypothetical protein
MDIVAACVRCNAKYTNGIPEEAACLFGFSRVKTHPAAR